MNERKILRIFPNASRSCVEANTCILAAKPGEQQGALVGPAKGEKEGVGRVIVRFTCYRRRLLDWDNLAASCKDLCDGLRHSHLIRDDSPKWIDASAHQIQVKAKAQEKTEIELIYPEA